jgi:hypothetical protein
MKKIFFIIILVLLLLPAASCSKGTIPCEGIERSIELLVYSKTGNIVYSNTEYGFDFSLPASWKGYSIVTGGWEGLPARGTGPVEKGPQISIRHPLWNKSKPRQDVPIMVFTIPQWQELQRDGIHIGAAPIGPSELGRNSRYVFALPARYNYAFPEGYEEVDRILSGKPLTTTEVFKQ